MAKIGIELNDVVRDFIGQFEYVYNKYYEKDVEITNNSLKSFNLEKYLPFEDGKKGMYDFLYGEGAFEINASAQILEIGLLNMINMFYLSLEKTDNEVWIVSREYYKSIPATLFFLAKGCQVPVIKFYKQYENLWDDVDILVTANPKVLNKKPNGKTGICITTNYNQNTKCDYRYKRLSEFLQDKETHKKLFDFKQTKDIEPIYKRFEKWVLNTIDKILYYKKTIKDIEKKEEKADKTKLDKIFKKRGS